MMKQFNAEALTLNYQLKRLVADKDSHSILAHRRAERIEVIPDTYMFYKVVTKDMLAPGKIQFSFEPGQYVRARRNSFGDVMGSKGDESPTPKAKVARQKVELQAYFSVSDKNREPTKENHDKAVDSPCGTIAMPIVGKDRFENEDVFISLYSMTGCTVYLTPSFPDLKIQNFHRKLEKEFEADEADFESYLVCKKWKSMNKNRGADKDWLIRDHV